MYMRKVILNIVLLLSVLACYAQGLRVSAPSHVMTGENFRLSYVINTQDAGEIRMGNIPDALEVITGPYCSSQSSYQVSTVMQAVLRRQRSHIYYVPQGTEPIRFRRHPLSSTDTGIPHNPI